ncbi:gluconolactonase [Actinomadura sp. LD22]|uniref:Gluconolactonase n=2 Tax=Actinomadura physcomitrii TaxID=2650748 RepID=A0A6I4MGI4_9ACTN|nr:gluconolactonase [Actinomadura physcomitrii]
MVANLETVASGLVFPEAPRWHEGRLWVSDIPAQEIVAVGPDGVVERMHEVPGRPGGSGWLSDGSLVVVSANDTTLVRFDPAGRRSVYADLNGIVPARLNDLIVDAHDSVWVGNLGFEFAPGSRVRPTQLVRVDPDGAAAPVGEEVWFPNGMAITPDGASLLVAESFAQRISAFPLQPSGELGPRRTWAAFGSAPVPCDPVEFMAAAVMLPDGMCLDAEGAVWVADAGGCRVLRVAEGGEVLREVKVSTGDRGVFACMLGGPDGDTLYICSSLPMHRHAEAEVSRNGSLLSLRAPAPRAGLP